MNAGRVFMGHDAMMSDVVLLAEWGRETKIVNRSGKGEWPVSDCGGRWVCVSLVQSTGSPE